MRVAPSRPARTSYGPFSGKPRIAADRPGPGASASGSGRAFSPGTRSTARSLRGSNAIAVASSCGPLPRSSTLVSVWPATTCALVTTTPSRATQPEPSTPSPHAVPRIFTTLAAAARTCGSRPIPFAGGATFASGPSILGNGSKRASAFSSGPDGGSALLSRDRISERWTS